MCQVSNVIVFIQILKFIIFFYFFFSRLSGHKDIDERLNDNLYEVLDVLSMYVFGRKAEHKNGEHMVNFDLNNESILDGDHQEAIKKMQLVNLF